MKLWKLALYSVLCILWSGSSGFAGPWAVYTPADGLADTTVAAVEIDANGVKWFGTLHGGASRFDGSSWKTYDAGDGLGANGVRVIAAGRNNMIWFATGQTLEDRFEGAGAARFDGNDWKRYIVHDGLADNNVRAIAEDLNGNMWFGTEFGVSRFDGNVWKTFKTADGLAHTFILSLAVDSNGAVWAGSVGGISRFDGMSWKSWTLADGLPHQYVTAIADSGNGIVYIGTWGGGAARFDGAAWSPVRIPGESESSLVSAAVFDSRGVLWIGTHQGLFRFNGSTWRAWTENDGLPRNAVNALALDDGMLWIGMSGGGAARFGDILTRAQQAARPLQSPIIRSVYPNPFNPAATVSFYLPEAGMAALSVHNISGQKIRDLANHSFSPGEHILHWDGRDGNGAQAASGVYFVRLNAAGRILGHKMVLRR